MAEETCHIETFQIEEWERLHPRWNELCEIVAAQGQTNWVEATAPYHDSSHVFVALWADEIAGFLRYVRQPIGPDADCPPVMVDGEELVEAKVLAFAVVERYRRRGIGRSLQQAAMHRAREQGCYQLRSHSSGSAVANHRLKIGLGFAIHPVVRSGDRQGVYFILPLRSSNE